MTSYLLLTFSVLLVYLILAESFLSSVKGEVEEEEVFDFKQTGALFCYLIGSKKIGPSAGRFAPLLLLLLRIVGGLYVLAFFAVIYIAYSASAVQ
jgi:hypothetical protein